MKLHYLLLAASCVLLASPPAARAEKIASIEAEGGLVTETGERLVLAGVALPPESLPLLSVLLSGKEVEIEKAGEEGKGGQPVFVFVNASELPMPFPDGTGASEKKVMLNEFLIRLGAARVLEDAAFERRSAFLELQNEARRRGEGIWSYEDSPPEPGV